MTQLHTQHTLPAGVEVQAMAGVVPPSQERVALQEVDVVTPTLVLQVLIGIVNVGVLEAEAVISVQDRAHDDVGFCSERLDKLEAELWAAVWSQVGGVVSTGQDEEVVVLGESRANELDIPQTLLEGAIWVNVRLHFHGSPDGWIYQKQLTQSPSHTVCYYDHSIFPNTGTLTGTTLYVIFGLIFTTHLRVYSSRYLCHFDRFRWMGG